MKRNILVVFLIICLLILSGTAIAYAAASDSNNVAVSATIGDAIQITLPAATLTLNVTVGSWANTAFDNIVVKTNCAWKLQLQANQVLTSGANTIPSSRFHYTVATTNGDAAAESECSTTATNVVTNGTATGDSGADVDITYKLQAVFSDAQGTYAATHTYTAATP